MKKVRNGSCFTLQYSSKGFSLLCVVDTGVEIGTPCKNNGCETVSMSVFCVQWTLSNQDM